MTRSVGLGPIGDEKSDDYEGDFQACLSRQAILTSDFSGGIQQPLKVDFGSVKLIFYVNRETRASHPHWRINGQ